MPAIRVTDNTATYEWYESDGPANEKLWKVEATGGHWQLETWTDAGGFGANAVQILRTGTTVDEIGLYATSIKFGTHSAIAAEALSGYITIKDAGGTTRKLAVIS